jgi:flagellar secretion chaperone FliS
MNRTDIAYRKTAAEGASGFGLLIALFDTLAGNLRRAADAQRINDLEKRSREVNHALLVIGYLEDWINNGSGGDLADKLAAFYSSLRGRLIEAQIKQSFELFEEQMRAVLKIRESWQQLDLHRSPEPQIMPSAASRSFRGYSSGMERSSSSWSA